MSSGSTESSISCWATSLTNWSSPLEGRMSGGSRQGGGGGRVKDAGGRGGGRVEDVGREGGGGR